MNATIVTLNIIVLSTLGALGYQWPPALFAFLIVGPISVLSIWRTTKGLVSARTIFVTTSTIAVTGIVVASYFWPAAWFGALVVGPIIVLGISDIIPLRS